MHIDIIKSQTSDNVFCLLYAEGGREGLLIDPVDADTALQRARALGVEITRVVNTHWHPDHTRGNQAVIEATGAELAVPAGERDMIVGGQRFLEAGDPIKVGDTTLEVLDTPGHTQGHISLYTPGHLFCGDTIFIGGAGNCRFGGDPRVLFRTFTQVIAALPDDALIYPGHDYALRNLEFCLHIEPNNRAAADKLEEARGTIAAGGYVQATLGGERTWSPFMRSGEPSLHEALQARHDRDWHSAGDGLSDAERAFVAVRAMRNTW